MAFSDVFFFFYNNYNLWVSIVVTSLLALVSWNVYLTISRLYLSPIAHIPGPKLAAASFWYEFYYDVVKSGRYTWRIAELHAKYGPVIRINPYEVHINDPDYYDIVYLSHGGKNHKIDSWKWTSETFGNPLSAFGAVDHDHHRIRRGPLDPFFSKQSIAQLELKINIVVERLLDQVNAERDTDVPVNMTDLFCCFAGEVIMEYSFGTNIRLLEDKKNHKDWKGAMDTLTLGANFAKQFPLWGRILRSIPPGIMGKLDERFMLFNEVLHTLQKLILKTQAVPAVEASSEYDRKRPETIIENLVWGPLPPEEKTMPRLIDECQSLVGAGAITTGEILAAALFHVLTNETIKKKVQDELSSLNPTNQEQPNAIPSLSSLEQLPYFNALIKETLRRHFGIISRLQRVHNIPITARSILIPPGTPISMSAFFMHLNPDVFPDPEAFVPERWLGREESPYGQEVQLLNKNFVPFSKGSRSCAGMNLAMAELRLCLAALLMPGRVALRLFETVADDVLPVHDFFIPVPRMDSKGVRVLVGGREGV